MPALTLRRQAGLAVCAIALTAASGCSLVFVDGPPPDHASRHFFDCTSSMLGPGLDAALAGTLALGAVGSISDEGSHDGQSIVTGSALVVGALASAAYGYVKVTRCREAKDALATRLLDMPYLDVPPWDPSRAAPPSGAMQAAPPSARDDPATAPAPRDPWLSEGPPPGDGRGGPMLILPPPPYLRLAPQTVPPPPGNVTSPPATAVPATPAPAVDPESPK